MKEKVKVFALYDVDGIVGENILLYGTMNDMRTWAKNLWKKDENWARENMADLVSHNLETEEEYYGLLDVDSLLVQFLDSMGYQMVELCEVPFDDFYDDKRPTQELIDEVLFQIKVDIAEGIEQPLLEEPKKELEAPKEEEDIVKKFAKWLIIHTDEVSNTAGACRRYKRKVYNVDELYDIFVELQIK